MSNQTDTIQQDQPRKKIVYRNSTSSAVYGLGFIGALVYYMQHATTFWIGVLGLLKAMVWPAMLIYRVLETLKM